VLGGVVALGPIGILIGPMIVVFLQTLLDILQRELRTMDTSSTTSADEATATGGTATAGVSADAELNQLTAALAAGQAAKAGLVAESATPAKHRENSSAIPQKGEANKKTKRK
jgi:ABC-type Co2+ transport system permease subunit